jgi:hypothetical protein
MKNYKSLKKMNTSEDEKISHVHGSVEPIL